MHTTFRLSVFLLFMVQLFCNCTSDSLPEPDGTQPETPAGIPDAYQDCLLYTSDAADEL